MAIDAVGELLGGVLRFVGRILVELVVELLLYGTGHLLLKPFYRGKEPSDGLCALVGLLAWAAFAVAAFMAYRYVQPPT